HTTIFSCTMSICARKGGNSHEKRASVLISMCTRGRPPARLYSARRMTWRRSTAAILCWCDEILRFDALRSVLLPRWPATILTPERAAGQFSRNSTMRHAVRLFAALLVAPMMPPPLAQPLPADPDLPAISDLVTASRILANEGILDSFGHVSAR